MPDGRRGARRLKRCTGPCRSTTGGGDIGASNSPTQHTLRWIRKQGYTAAVVERWNPHALIRQDLYGIVDILAVGHGRTVAIQSTSYSNVSARVKKVQESDVIATLCDAGWLFIVQGWRKPKARWEHRSLLITPDQQEDLCLSKLAPAPAPE